MSKENEMLGVKNSLENIKYEISLLKVSGIKEFNWKLLAMERLANDILYRNSLTANEKE